VNEVSNVPSVAFTDANENLKKEGIPEEKIFLVGNVMVDSLLFNLEIPNYRCLAPYVAICRRHRHRMTGLSLSPFLKTK
jgi:UDP-N-acetylglucosamine 2-epimerase